MFLTAVFVTWASSAYAEYKLLCRLPETHWLKRLFHHPAGGILMSLAIGSAVGAMLGLGSGVIVGIANAIGLATNNLTYPFFSGLARANQKRKDVQTKVATYKEQHPTVFNEAVEGIKAGFKVIGAICLGIVWLFGLPMRIHTWCKSAIAKIKSIFTKKAVTS